MSTELATTETARLSELETVIERGLETFLEVGQALMEIRESKLYRETHRRFGDYVRERWGFSARRARQLVRAAEIGTVVPLENEAQARAFGGLKDTNTLRGIWHEAEVLARESDSEVTAAVIKEAAKMRRQEMARRRKEDERAFRMVMSARGTYRGGGKPVRGTHGTLEASDRAHAVSDEIRLVLGPWTADGELPEHRRVPESATVATWRRQLANGNGSAPPDVRKIIASIERLRASLPLFSPDRDALTKALEALGEVT